MWTDMQIYTSNVASFFIGGVREWDTLNIRFAHCFCFYQNIEVEFGKFELGALLEETIT